MDPRLYFVMACFISIVAVAAIWGRISLRKQITRIATSVQTQPPPRPETSITIERDGGKLWLRPLSVYIDGRKVGDISPSEVKYFTVSPGEHTVWVRMDWLRTMTTVVHVVAGQQCYLQCGIQKRFYHLNAPIWSCLLFHPRRVLYLEKILSADAQTESRSKVIPLTIGFCNLSGDDLVPLLVEDATSLSPLFQNINIAPIMHPPRCEILFLYGHLQEDGTLVDLSAQIGLRQIAQLTGAALIVLASPNPTVWAEKLVALPGPQCANLVITINRHANEFSKFFRALFERMEIGKSLFHSWVELAPQTPGGNPWPAPVTILLAEAGNFKFPDSVPNKQEKG